MRTNSNNKVHSLKFSIVDSSLILDFALQEVARIGPQMALYALLHGDQVSAAGGTWMWEGARPALAAGQHHVGQR